MPGKWTPKITKARFHVAGYTGEQMAAAGSSLIDSIRARLALARDVYDQPAPLLSMKYIERKDADGRMRFGADCGYRAQKARRTGAPIRNWRLTGLTLSALQVLTAGPNRVRIGFASPEANRRAFFNNRRHRQFGVSPRDKQNLMAAFLRTTSPVRATRVA